MRSHLARSSSNNSYPNRLNSPTRAPSQLSLISQSPVEDGGSPERRTIIDRFELANKRSPPSVDFLPRKSKKVTFLHVPPLEIPLFSPPPVAILQPSSLPSSSQKTTTLPNTEPLQAPFTSPTRSSDRAREPSPVRTLKSSPKDAMVITQTSPKNGETGLKITPSNTPELYSLMKSMSRRLEDIERLQHEILSNQRLMERSNNKKFEQLDTSIESARSDIEIVRQLVQTNKS